MAATGPRWLLDPALPPDPVRRAWSVDLQSKASTLAASHGLLLVGKFRADGPTLVRVDLDHLDRTAPRPCW